MNSKIVSGLLLALCAIGIWQVTVIPESTMYSEVGPILAPSVVIGVLTILGIIYLLTSVKGDSPDCIDTEDEKPEPNGNLRIIYFLASGLLFIVLIKPIGFIVPATLCGVGIARAFDAPLKAKTFFICGSISLVFWGLFSALLGVDLGPMVKLPFLRVFMGSFESLMQGFAVALQPMTLLYGFVGCLVGTLIGVLPGIGPALTIALLLPLTFKVPATAMFVLFAGIYYGAMYGGSTTSILLNTPGESATIVTSLEGNKMARKGRAGPALATAAIGSFIAGTIGTIALTFFAPLVVDVALAFGPAEYFSLMTLALIMVSAVLGNSALRGLISLFAGLLFGLVGIDLQTGQARFTFGQPELLDGIEVTIAAVGLFAIGEALFLAWQGREGKNTEVLKVSGSLWLSKDDWKRSWKPWFRGAFFGFPVGAMPAGGAELPTLLSYYTEKKLAKNPEEFGHGAIEGVAGPEAANNASAAGVLMPLLTLGIPTSATAAIILSAFESYGIQVGPQLFTQQSGLVWTLIASLYIGNIILLILNLPLVGLWVKLLKIPPPWLYAGIIIISTAGVYGSSNSAFDVGLLFFFGLLGFVMRRFDFPAAPMIIGLILGPMAEQSMRQAMTISQGQWSTFFTRPISGSIMLIAIALLVIPPLIKLAKIKRFGRSIR